MIEEDDSLEITSFLLVGLAAAALSGILVGAFLAAAIVWLASAGCDEHHHWDGKICSAF